MSSWSGSEDCPKCGGKDSLKTFGSNKPYDSVNGNCLECGWKYWTDEDFDDLEEVNLIRESYGLEPLTTLAEPIN